ncbi:aKG-HExxH-type peptide beta-hydroxylase [Xenorhabdus miraniensis]|uniref:Uncharacterized protein n=1 Tax=Xenorhabdus miraniensis TaxID=351674 RepID=A0A2D0JJD6_9GAMM|nr:HEXXH motif-containing putative peptide modification protein [Xenorhabdus miraniensis]PHM45567.1 hypothetical protein Xmir_04276 [Xenorhabdus miraniensis]
MLSILGKDEIIKNVYLLSRSLPGSENIKKIEDLKPFYLDFLKNHQPYHPINFSDEIIVSNEEKINSLILAYQPSALDDLNQVKMIGEKHRTDKYQELSTLVKNGYTHLADSDKDVKLIFDLVIHTIFFRKSTSSSNVSSFGGSSSTAIGSIWISGHGALTLHDIAEFLLHELTHHLLFIDERCHEQFHYAEIIKPENYSTSALLGKKSPLDKVVHSILVSHEILNARQKFLNAGNVTIHPKTNILKKNTNQSIAEILGMKNLNNLITNRTKEFIMTARENLN